MERRNKQFMWISVCMVALIIAAAVGSFIHEKQKTPASAQVLLHDAIQAAKLGNKNVLVLFEASW